MDRRFIIPKLPYEKAIRSIFGSDWRSLSRTDKDGAFGVAIVFSVLNDKDPDLYAISKHLNISTDLIYGAFTRLSANGIFLRGRIENDRQKLKSFDKHTLGYYAGYASGLCGNVEVNIEHRNN